MSPTNFVPWEMLRWTGRANGGVPCQREEGVSKATAERNPRRQPT